MRSKLRDHRAAGSSLRRGAALLMANVLIACGCASTAPVRVDQAADAKRCASFDWLTSAATASLTEQRVREEALRVLREKGYPQNSAQPDCKISYQFSAYETPKSGPSVGVGVGGGAGGIGGGIGVSVPVGRKKEQAGTFTLDIIDTAKNAQIWSGSIDGNFESSELTPEETKEVVQAVLDEYPANDAG